MIVSTQVLPRNFGASDACDERTGHTRALRMPIETSSIMQLVSRNIDWLSHRMAIVAENISNLNTPAYHARDLTPFANILDQSDLSIATTDLRHLELSPIASTRSGATVTRGDETNLTGNDVGLESQLAKLSEISHAFSLSIGIKRTIHQMLLASQK